MKPVRSIVVVGAGTSGWMAASMIKKHCPEIDVTIIYNSRIPTMGVGETLTFRMPGFMKWLLGLKDEDWMPRCQATYKSGVKWINWGYPGEIHQTSNIDEFAAHNLLHIPLPPRPSAARPFNTLASGIDPQLMITDLWRNMHAQGMIKDPIAHMQASLCDHYYFALNNRSPRALDGTWLTDEVYGFSYHYNAEVVSNVIGDLVGRPAGVRSQDANIVDVVMHGTDIKHLVLEDGSTVSADIFVDCSGFRRLLISRVGTEWIESDEFCNNSAIVKQVSYDGQDHAQHRVSNSTTFSRMDSGWRFSIPLQHRSGNGYIFNTRITPDIDPLIEEFNNSVSDTGDVRLIQWRPGHYKNIMTGNCVAFGLSLGFSDPFDANNLSLTIHVLESFVRALHSPMLKDLPDLADGMNKIAGTFWRDVEMRIKSALRLSPRGGTLYYDTLHQANRDSRFLEEFVDYVEDVRRRYHQGIHNDYTLRNELYHFWSFTTLAMRYGIDLPTHDVDPDLASIARPYFEMRRARNQYMARHAPALEDFYREYFGRMHHAT